MASLIEKGIPVEFWMFIVHLFKGNMYVLVCHILLLEMIYVVLTSWFECIVWCCYNCYYHISWLLKYQLWCWSLV
jgi:hypothetical protein